MIRTLTGENKSSDLSPEIMNDALLDQTCKSLSAAKQIDVIHDPSDIRKPHSKKTENLGKVRDLSGNVINGYSTHCYLSPLWSHFVVTLMAPLDCRHNGATSFAP